MQQTETYQLNLIETSDTFSPEPLNENMEKVEAKFAGLDQADAALNSRVTVLEGHKIAVGSYTGGGSQAYTVQVGFRPRAVIIQQATHIGDCFMATAAGGCVTLTDTGFALKGGEMLNNGSRYNYIAIG
ncbi:MAG: hypothetical protein K2M42_11455 [Oscillospiraceae bacterium]|nr:hypothetical protein [Oscillospiraceae bacterium]